MKTKLLFIIAATCGVTAQAQDFLQGDEKDACEAIMCLSSGQRPDECSPPIQRYLSIKKKKPSDTIKSRRDFLKKCPASQDDSKMESLVNAIANGAGRCDAETLNAENKKTIPALICNGQAVAYVGAVYYGDESCYYGEVTVIDSTKPNYCSIYESHEYTDLITNQVVYVGSPLNGGHWANN